MNQRIEIHRKATNDFYYTMIVWFERISFEL